MSKEFNAVHVYILYIRLYTVHRIKVDFKESDLFLTLDLFCTDMNGSTWKEKHQV